MVWDNKVVWSEGMFLQPQHFQQQDRYFERLLRERLQGQVPHSWGITDIKIDHDLLSIGKFAISNCEGVFDDGTPFRIPEGADQPDPIDIPEGARDKIVFLTLPLRRSGGTEIAFDKEAETTARYRTKEFEVTDTVEGNSSSSVLQVGRLNTKFMLETDAMEGFSGIALARIIEKRADNQVILDEKFIPTCLSCNGSNILKNFFSELQGLLHHRGQALAGRVSQGGSRGSAEIADFLMLQLVNRYEPLLAHLGSVEHIHPERFFATVVQIAGELSTFTTPGKRPIAYPAYNHTDLEHSFRTVITDLRQSLSAVLEQTALSIDLQEHKFGIRVATINDPSLYGSASFVLAVKADVPSESLRRNFPNQIKVGPVEQIRELVNSALPGIKLNALPVAPRQIPYHDGVAYFELDRSGEMWKTLQKSSGIAMHLAGDYPGLELEFWAIRRV